MAPTPQDFGIGIAVVLAVMAFYTSLVQLLWRALPRLGYLCFLACLYEHATTGDRFFTRHLWEAMAVSAAVVMFLDNRFPLFGLTCLAVIADFVRLYPTTAYKDQTGITIAVAVALLGWRYLAREDGPEPGSQAPPSGDFGGFAPGPPDPAPRPRRRPVAPSRRPAPAPRRVAAGTGGWKPVLRRIRHRVRTSGQGQATSDAQHSPWRGIYGQDDGPSGR